MAVSTAIAAGEAIISASGVVEVIKGYTINIVKEEFGRLKEVKGDIEKLGELFGSLQDTVVKVEKKRVKTKSEQEFIVELKYLAYDMEDILDEWVLLGLANDAEQSGVIMQLKGMAVDGFYLVCDLLLGCCNISTPVTSRRKIAHDLVLVNKRLDKLKKIEDSLGAQEGLSGVTNHSETLETSHLVDKEHPMVGRHEIKAKIKTRLLNSGSGRVEESSSTSSSSSSGAGASTNKSSEVSIIGIIGMGGMGKSTLARDLLNDNDIVAAFPMRKWVHVGENFDVKKLIGDIIGDTEYRNKNLADLQMSLINNTRNEKFMIILDDAWSTDSEKWGLLWAPLTHGEKGGAIIVTTRDVAVVRAMPGGPRYSEHQLEGMSTDECMEVFKTCAFEGLNPVTYSHLEGLLCEQIVQKLKGVPLAATMMGKFLRSHLHNEGMWRDVANDTKLVTDKGDDLVDQVIGLSYCHLPSHLKHCFAYCSIFPKGTEFDEDLLMTLVQLWIAQGYVQPCGNQLLEHIARGYFDDLYRRSFFQLGNYNRYFLHDLVHDFAQKAFAEGTCQVTFPMDHAPSSQVRHLTLCCQETDSTTLEKLCEYNKLRTFMFSCQSINAFPANVFAEFKHIRVLMIVCDKFSECPDSICHLKLLRYLDFSWTSIRSLPETVCSLLKLQVLKLPDEDCELPEGVNKLVNLRHLEGDREKIASLKEIGRLTSLQKLELFLVGRESGRKIEELKRLNHIHGKLCMRCLRNIKDQEEARLAELNKKVYLEELELVWDLDKSSDEEESVRGGCSVIERQVLEGLKPPRHLKSLEIMSYLGVQLPSCMEDESKWVPPSLQSLRIENCSKLTSLSPFLRHLTRLRKLDIINCAKLVSLEDGCSQAFPFLQDVFILYCPELTSLFSFLRHLTALRSLDIRNYGELLSLEEDGCGQQFPSLENICIIDCPKLTSLSQVLCHSTALRELTIASCDGLVTLVEDGCSQPIFPLLQEMNIECCPNLTSLSKVLCQSVALRRLSIKYCDELVLLEDGDGQVVLCSLQTLRITSCRKLTSLSRFLRLSHLTELKSFEIERCSELVSLDEDGCGQAVLPSLQNFSIMSCHRLASLSPLLRHLTALKTLYIRDCEQLASLGEEGCGVVVSPSLRDLGIESCGKLTSLSALLRHPVALVKLKIKDCEELVSLGEDGCGRLPQLPSLVELTILGCPKLMTPISPTVQQATDDSGVPGPTSSSLLSRGGGLDLQLRLQQHDDDHQGDNHLEDEEGMSSSSSPSLASWQIKDLCTDSRPVLMWLLPQKLTDLEQLEIVDCSDLVGFTEAEEEGWRHLVALKFLSMKNCAHLESLPSNMHTLRSLQGLWLANCPEVRCLPESGLPGSLQGLVINECPQLEERCQENGPDRHKIPEATFVRFEELPDSD